MPHVHLISGSNTISLHGLVFPCKEALDLGLAMAMTEGGEVYVSRKAAPSLMLIRTFAGIRNEEHRALKDWYISISQGMRNPFGFIDADITSYTVRWINSPFDWQKDAENRWSGEMRLRVEDFEA